MTGWLKYNKFRMGICLCRLKNPANVRSASDFIGSMTV